MSDNSIKHDYYTTPKQGWVCFHCGEHFPGTRAGEKAAREHFSNVPTLPPECLDAASTARKLARRARRAEAESREAYKEAERLLHLYLSLDEDMRRLRVALKATKTCNALQAADHLYGRVLAAEAVVEYIAQRFPNIVQKARQSV